MRISDWSSDVCSSDLGAPLSDALVRGEVTIAPLLYNIVWTKKRDGAPVEAFFPPEGVPMIPYAAGLSKTAANPNAAKLFMNWGLSAEGQKFMIENLGNLTSVTEAPDYPEGFDPDVVKIGRASCRDRVCWSVKIAGGAG